MSKDERDRLRQKWEEIGVNSHTKDRNIGIEPSPLDTLDVVGGEVKVTSYSVGERPVIVDGGSHTSIKTE